MVLNFLKTFVVDGKRKQTNFVDKILSGEKIHTIRWDINNRWKVGNKIHFSTGARTSNYNCFKEGKCIGIQEIEITKEGIIYIDDCSLNHQTEFDELWLNDGFDSGHDFWAWFNQYKPFKGKIIHWTNFLY